MAFDFNGSRPKTPPVPPRSSPTPAPPPPSFSSVGKKGTSGFQNRPELRNDQTGSQVPVPAPPKHRTGKRGPFRSPVRRRPSGPPVSIPWNVVITIVGIIAVIVALWVFRDEISVFLSQVLSWVIMIVIILGVLKFFLLPRR